VPKMADPTGKNGEKKTKISGEKIPKF